jgi:hypothetical protein
LPVEEIARYTQPGAGKRHTCLAEADGVCRRARVGLDARFEVQPHGRAHPERRMIGERKSRAFLLIALLLFLPVPFLDLLLPRGTRTVQRMVLGGWL